MHTLSLVALALGIGVGLTIGPDPETGLPKRATAQTVEITVEQRVAQFGPAVRGRLAPDFARVGVAYPPRTVVLAAFKQERILEVWVAGPDRRPKLLRSYLLLAASGMLGPKLREGDHQVPEGLYNIAWLHPNSQFHLGLTVNYPNPEDLAQAETDGRTRPGSAIMIHGKASSVGCLAVGDHAVEDLFILAADTGLPNIELIISPVDMRKRSIQPGRSLPAWTRELYRRINVELAKLN
jgi:hypothetical protein